MDHREKNPYPVFEPQSYMTTMWLQYISTSFNLSEEYFTTYIYYTIIYIIFNILCVFVCVCIIYSIYLILSRFASSWVTKHWRRPAPVAEARLPRPRCHDPGRIWPWMLTEFGNCRDSALHYNIL